MGFSWCEWGVSGRSGLIIFFLLSYVPFFHDFFRTTYPLIKGYYLHTTFFWLDRGAWGD
ncbi:hypothetical protein COCVIDRAFT_114033 [Bipolaris victoriae FI3]|uniref:Uncharacterized protein n=1 Tax=Bipolaris victoriae (strain FI3) TaxID=930091 RepID=W7DTB1_BIPV3|nr:hypothetical protein COCVIDRAFT_114033 [Bipolaris victoriae FI3]